MPRRVETIDPSWSELEVLALDCDGSLLVAAALKIRFPDKIHLLRGNHEDKWINNAFGFAEECSNRLGDDRHPCPSNEQWAFHRW